MRRILSTCKVLFSLLHSEKCPDPKFCNRSQELFAGDEEMIAERLGVDVDMAEKIAMKYCAYILILPISLQASAFV